MGKFINQAKELSKIIYKDKSKDNKIKIIERDLELINMKGISVDKIVQDFKNKSK